MKVFAKWPLLVTIVMAWTICSGQSIDMKDIKEFDSLSNNTKLLYFHFKGCSACRQMEQEVFSQQYVYEFVNQKFEVYSVFGFGEYEKKIRNTFNNQSNPEFIILDSTNKISHRFLGYHNEKDFLNRLEASFTSVSLTKLESAYGEKKNDISFMKEYIDAKDAAGLLDSSEIFQLLSLFDETSISEDFLTYILKYAYHDRNFIIKSGSKYHKVLEEAYNKNEFSHLNEYIRQRLMFINFIHFNKLETTQEKEQCIAEIMKLENGNHNGLQILNSEYFHAFIPERYPSFDLKYNLIQEDDHEAKLNLLLDHTARIANDSRELNHLAWGIYQGTYDYDVDTGIKIVKESIELDRKYHNLDTLAALQFKKGDLENAYISAQHAIIYAEQNNIDHHETLKLLKEIEELMKK